MELAFSTCAKHLDSSYTNLNIKATSLGEIN